MKKNTKDPFMRTRIIISTIVLSIFIIGWIIYGYNITRSNPKLILRKYLTTQEQNINNFLNNKKIDFSSPHNYILKSNNKIINIYLNLKDNKIYIYNDTNYYDLANYLNNKGININYKELNNKNLKTIINRLKESIINNEKILESNNLNDKNKNYYLYHYTLNEISPLISTLKTDKEFINTTKKILGISDKDLDTLLNNIYDKSFGISIGTKGSTREIIYHSLKINSIITIKEENKILNGFLGNNYSFIFDKKLILSDDSNDYEISTNNKEFNIDNLTETSLEDILNNQKTA